VLVADFDLQDKIRTENAMSKITFFMRINIYD
jgi:hypothetical protein